MISAMGVERPERWSEQMRPYYQAKRDADEALEAAGLEHTIVRPGMLTDEEGRGLIEVGAPLGGGGPVERDDVAATLLACLDEPRTARLSFDVLRGTVPIPEAIASLVGARD
jgi:uncharacterized protein YbjT (DUF2867 family)